MIYSTVKRVCDAGVCEQGRVDSYAALAKHGLTDTDKISALWCLDNCGVPGTLWAMGHVLPSSEAEAEAVLRGYLHDNTLRFAQMAAGWDEAWVLRAQRKVLPLLSGVSMNLGPLYGQLREASADPARGPGLRAMVLMLYKALQPGPLNVRCVEVFEQAMLAATYPNNSRVPHTDGYRAEYKRQFNELRRKVDTA